MRIRLQTSLAVLLTAVCAVATGCVVPRRSVPESAVFCAKCKVVWVDVFDPDDPYRMPAASQEVMQCPDCENAVIHFFKTGKLEHACSTCGTELVHCTSH